MYSARGKTIVAILREKIKDQMIKPKNIPYHNYLRTGHPRPYAVVWRPQHPNHYSELVYVIFSRENGGKIQKLPEDASHGPEIHGIRVLPGAIEQLRRPVPTRRNLVGIKSIFFLAVENTAQAEVSNLQLSFGTVSKGEINLANSCNRYNCNAART